MTEHEQAEVLLLHAREAWHVRISDDVRGMLVESRVGDGETHLVQARGPGQHQGVVLDVERCLPHDLTEKVEGKAFHARGVARVHLIALHELLHGAVAQVAVLEAADQIVENAFAHGARGNRHAFHLKLGKDGGHDREAARQHRHAIGPQLREARSC